MLRILGKLVAWANRWDIDFNVNKCGVMYTWKRNLELKYQMNDLLVKSVDDERDLGVLNSKDSKFLKQYLLEKIKVI